MSVVEAELRGKNAGFKKMLKNSRDEVRSFSKDVVNGLNLSNQLQGANLLGSISGHVKQAFNELLETFDRTAKLAAQTDWDADKLHQYGQAAQRSGADVEKLSKGVNDATKRAVQGIQGNKGYADSFKDLGINAKEFLALPAEERLLAMADGYANATNKAEAYNAITELMGDAGAELIPMLTMGAAGLREFAEGVDTLSDAEFRAIEQLNDELKDLDNSLKVKLGGTLPFFAALWKTVWNVAEAAMRPVTEYLGVMVGMVAQLTQEGVSMGDRMKGAWDILNSYGSNVVDGMKEDIGEIKDAWNKDGSQKTMRDEMEEASREAVKIRREAEALAEAEKKAAAEAEKLAKKKDDAAKREAEKKQREADALAREKEKQKVEAIRISLEMTALRAQLRGEDQLAKRLRIRKELGERTLEIMNRTGASMDYARKVAVNQLKLEQEQAKVRKGLESAREREGGLASERDQALRQAAGFRGSPSSLESIGLGAGGVNYAANNQVKRLEDLAVKRNLQLEELKLEIADLELRLSEDKF